MGGRNLRRMGAVVACCAALTAGGRRVQAAGGVSTATVLPGAGLTVHLLDPAASLDVRAAVPAAGRVRTEYFPPPVLIAADTRGTGAGWHLLVQTTPVSFSAGTLPPGSLIMAVPSIVCGAGARCTGQGALPVVASRRPLAIDGTGAVAVARAAEHTGMGSYVVRGGTLDGVPGHALALQVPPSPVTRTYATTLTFSIVSGP